MAKTSRAKKEARRLFWHAEVGNRFRERCPCCGDREAHFVSPSLGDRGFFICQDRVEDRVRRSLEAGPPLDATDDVLIPYLNGLQYGERVVECGQSALRGRRGTVYLSERDRGVCVRWDRYLGEPVQMGTSVTGGTRRLVEEPET